MAHGLITHTACRTHTDWRLHVLGTYYTHSVPYQCPHGSGCLNLLHTRRSIPVLTGGFTSWGPITHTTRHTGVITAQSVWTYYTHGVPYRYPESPGTLLMLVTDDTVSSIGQRSLGKNTHVSVKRNWILSWVTFFVLFWVLSVSFLYFVLILIYEGVDLIYTLM